MHYGAKTVYTIGLNGRGEAAASAKTNAQNTPKGEPTVLSSSNMERGVTAAFPSSAGVMTNTYDRKSAPSEAKREFFDQIKNFDIT